MASLGVKGCLAWRIFSPIKGLPLLRAYVGPCRNFRSEPILHRPGSRHSGPVHRDLPPAHPEPPVPHRHQVQPHRPAADGRPVSEFGSCRAQGPTALFWALGPPISPGARAPPAPWPTRCTAPRRGAPWPTPGCRCSPTSTPRSRPTASCIPTRPPLLVDTYKCSSPACPTPSGPSRRSCSPGHYQLRHPAGQRRPHLSLRKGPEDAGCGRADRVQDRGLQLPGRVYHPGSVASGGQDRLLRRGRAAHHLQGEPVFGGVTSWPPWRTGGQRSFPRSRSQRIPAKITNPHFKKVYRLFENESGKAIADLITVYDEAVDESSPWSSLTRRPPGSGKSSPTSPPWSCWYPSSGGVRRVYHSPSITEMRAYCAARLTFVGRGQAV